MANYFDSLTAVQKKNVDAITRTMIANGFNNAFAIAAILAVSSKEGSFNPRFEEGYGTTDNARIRAVFGSRLKSFTDAQLSLLKKDNVKFFNTVYGGEWGRKNLGNTQPNDGYNFRGGGHNQLTGRDLYTQIGKKIKVDLANHPEKINEPDVAAKALIQYFIDRFHDKGNQLKAYNSTGINAFKSTADAVGAFYHANAGWGHTAQWIKDDVTGGRKKALERVDGFFSWVKNGFAAAVTEVAHLANESVKEVKNNPATTVLTVAALLAVGWLILK